MKSVIKTEILYPVFLQVCHLTEDSFWRHLFEDLSYGLCPMGTFIDRGSLCCKLKGKQFSCTYDDKSPTAIYEAFRTVLHDKLHLTSNFDYYNELIQFNTLLRDTTHLEWSDIKKKNIKDILIENYVIELKKEHLLNNIQTRKLLSSILMGFHFKILTNKDVHYDPNEGCIMSITGVEVSRTSPMRIRGGQKNGSSDAAKIQLNSSPLTTTSAKKPRLKDVWSKYVAATLCVS